MLSYLLPKLRDIFFMALFFAVVGFGPRLFNVDGDLGRHITVGEYILQEGHIPTRDVFSHTMRGQPLTPHEWLADLIFALAHRLAGLDGVVWLTALMVALTFTLVMAQSYERSRLILLSLGMALWAAAASSLHWLARPHLWTMLFLSLWTCGLETMRRGGRFRWYLLPLLMLVWANTHGAFIAGFVVWGAYGVESLQVGKFASVQVRRLGWIGALSLGATFLNPAGWRLWETTFGFLHNRYLVSHTAEYLPPDFHDPSTWPFLGLVAFSVLVLALKGRRLPLSHALLLSGWTAMGLYSARNIPLYAIVAAPILAETVASGKLASLQVGKFESLKVGKFAGLQVRLGVMENSLKGALWPVAFALLMGAALLSGARLDFGGRGNVFLPEVFPVQAADWLETHPQEGNVFNYFPWGGYLLYRFEGRLPVFIDGQTDFYGEALTRRYEQVITLAEGWPEALAEYRVTWVLVPADSPLVPALEARGWRRVYEDATAIIVVHE